MTIELLYDLYQRHASVQTDTRQLKQGDLFFALKGPNFNGNAFALRALELGAAYAITPRWHVYSSYSIARVNTHVTADTEGVIRTTTIKFGPQTLVISGGYSFGR